MTDTPNPYDLAGMRKYVAKRKSEAPAEPLACKHGNHIHCSQEGHPPACHCQCAEAGVSAPLPAKELRGVIDERVQEFMDDMGIDRNVKIVALFCKKHDQRERVFNLLIAFERFMHNRGAR